jgi:DUF2975 family protein
MTTAQNRRIRVVSTMFRVITLLGLILMAIGAVALLTLDFDSNITFGMGHWKIKDLKPEFSWMKRPFILLVLTFPFVGLWRLYRLFSLTAKESYFTAEAVRHIKFLGYWMIAYSFASFGLQFLQLLSMSINYEFKLPIDGYLFGGILVLLLGWITDEGRKIHEEQQLTV